MRDLLRGGPYAKQALSFVLSLPLARVPLPMLATGPRMEEDPKRSAIPRSIRLTALQTNCSNVAKLQVAWTYDTADGTGDPQTQPVIIDGVLFGITPKHKVIALDAATGGLIWRFDSGIRGRGPNRGIVYWAAGRDRRVFAAVQSYVYALDASNDKPILSFGKEGRIDLREDLGRDPQKQSIILTTPGIVYTLTARSRCLAFENSLEPTEDG